jgi:hypothetical protein
MVTCVIITEIVMEIHAPAMSITTELHVMNVQLRMDKNVTEKVHVFTASVNVKRVMEVNRASCGVQVGVVITENAGWEIVIAFQTGRVKLVTFPLSTLVPTIAPPMVHAISRPMSVPVMKDTRE